MKKLIVAIMAMALLASIPAMARQNANPSGGKPAASATAPKLTVEDVSKFISVFPELTTQFKEFEKLMPSGTNGNTSMAKVQQVATAMKAQAKLQEFAKEKGYKDSSDLMQQISAIVSGLAVLKFEEASTAMKAQTASAPAQVQAMMKAQMQAMEKQLAQSRKMASKETLDSVKAKLPELEAMFQSLSKEK